VTDAVAAGAAKGGEGKKVEEKRGRRWGRGGDRPPSDHSQNSRTSELLFFKAWLIGGVGRGERGGRAIWGRKKKGEHGVSKPDVPSVCPLFLSNAQARCPDLLDGVREEKARRKKEKEEGFASSVPFPLSIPSRAWATRREEGKKGKEYP